MSNKLTEKVNQKKEEFIPNFTQYPNEILDSWMPFLTGNQTKIINVFVRQIYGYHKKHDQISIRQISQRTGITPSNVFKDIKILLKIGCLKILKQGNKVDPHTYQIINITEELSSRLQLKDSRGVIPEITESYRRDNTCVIPEITEVLSQREQQNKDLNKSKINVKERESKPIQETPLQSESLTHSQSFQSLGIGIQRPEQILQAIYRQLSSEGIKFDRGSDVQAYIKYRDQIEADPSLLIEKINRMRKLAWLKENYVPLKRNITNEKAVKILDGMVTMPNTFSWAFSNYSTEVEPLFDLVKNLKESLLRKEEKEKLRKEEDRQARLEQEERLRELSWEEKEAGRKKIEDFNRRWQAKQSETTEQPSQPAVQVPETIREQIDRITRQAEGRTLTEEEREVLKRLFQMGREGL